MTCAEFQEQVELFAANALDPVERAALERHLSGEGPHSGCLEALRTAEGAWLLLAESLPPARPGPRLWRSVYARISRPAGVPAWAGWAVAAAALLFLLFLSGVRAKQVQEASAAKQRSEAERLACARDLEALRSSSGDLREAVALLAAPDTTVVQLLSPQAGSGLAARALVNLSLRRGVLVSTALTARPGKDFELWIIRGDQKFPAGLLRASARGEVVAAIDPGLLAVPPDALAITLEPEGGSNQPRGDIVLVAKVPHT